VSALRRLLVRAPFAARVDLRGKRIVVTGTAHGSIGFETARALAVWGADVVVTTRRDTEAVAAQLRAVIANEPGHGTVTAQSLDLADAASVERFAAWYRDSLGERLDVLVNNAGIHLDLLSQWKEPKLTADGHELHWRTNYLGTMHLTLRLLPLLQATARAHGGARIVNVVSMLHAKGRNTGLFGLNDPYNSWVAYGNSKLALVHATQELQRRHAAEGVQAYSLHPGAVYTNIADKGLAGNPMLERLRKTFAFVERFFLLTPEEGAQTTLLCATAPSAKGGAYYRNGAVAKASAECADAAVSTRLLDETIRQVDALR
jgi:NAD(P)-dependent dehydrogenase (short-subunit alcohol dehydrogenase family)